MTEEEKERQEWEKEVKRLLDRHPFFTIKKHHSKMAKTLFNKKFTSEEAYKLILLSN